MNTKHILLLMATTLIMVGCAFDDPMEKQKPWEENDSELPKPVTFSVSTANNVDFTRAATSIVTFNQNEKIRVLVKPQGSEAYTPYDYTATETGHNVALSAPDPQPYFPAGVHTTVEAYAFYPATANTGVGEAFTVADYQRDDADYKASDLMMADNRIITKDVEDGSNKLTMKHLMAQLRVKAVPDENSDLKINKIVVEAKRSLYFTPEASAIATTGEETGTITVLNEVDLAAGVGGEGYILLPPQAISGVTIKVITGSGRPREIATYGFTAEGTFQAGASYGVDITVTPEQLGFTTAIANWNGMGSVLIAPSGDLIIDPIDAQPFVEGHPATPALTVRKGTTVLTVGTHYEVKYLNNTQAGTAYAVVTGLKSDLDPEDENYFDYTSSCGVAPFTITGAFGSIYYDATEVEATYGDEPFITHLSIQGDGTVVYSSSDETIATVDAVTGQVTTVKPGTTTIKAKVFDGANYVYPENAREASYTLVVKKAAGSIKFDELTPSQAWNSDDSQNNFTQAVTHVGTGTVTYTVPATTSADNTCGATISGSTLHFTGAGQVVVTATAADDDYYTYAAEHRTATYTFTATKAKGYVNLSAYSGSVPYNETMMLITIGEGQSHGGTLSVASADATIATAELDANNVHIKGVKAGTTKIIVTCAETARYFEAKAEFTVEVGKVAITGTTAPTANDLTYTTTAQPLVTASVVSGGTMQYRLNEMDNWSDDIPTGTNAGHYTVYWRVKGDNNHNDNSGSSVNVTIKPKTVTTPTITLGTNSFTYNGSAHTPAVSSVNDGSATIPASEYTVSYSNNKNAGTATVAIADKDGGNYIVSGTKTFTINPKSLTTPTITLATTSYTYDGTAKQPAISYVKDGETTVPASEYTVSYSNNINAGTATVTISDKAGGDYTISGSKTFTINKRALTITAKAQTVTYRTAITKTAAQVTANNLVSGHTISAVTLAQSTTNATTNGTITPSGATIKDGSNNTMTGNYNITYANGVLTINPYKLSASELKFASTAITRAYIWELSTMTNALTKPSDCTVTYSSSVTGVATVNSSTGALTPGGTLNTNTTITATATGNYSGSATYTIKANSNQISFSYTGGVQSMTPSKGTYKLEVWGAAGGDVYSLKGGYGAYATGKVALAANEVIYIMVGQEGYYVRNKYCTAYPNGGMGGASYYAAGGSGNCVSGSGGGSTHIATVNSLPQDMASNYKTHLLILAGGGGVATCHDRSNDGVTAHFGWYASGGHAGGIQGNNGQDCPLGSYLGGKGGTQSSGGAGAWLAYDQTIMNGAFGRGNNKETSEAGGGGGLYGGGGSWGGGGGGGSSYIGNSRLTGNTNEKRMVGYSCATSGTASTYTLSTTNVSSTAYANYAKDGSGYARITWVSN